MKTKLITTIMVTLFLASITIIAVPVHGTTINYGDVTLSGGFQTGHFDEVWDITAGDLVISFTYNANGLVDDAGCHAWAEIGIRAVGYGDFNPTWMSEGAGVWLATDYDWTVDTFDPDLPGSPTLDTDDKLILQKGGGWDESYYSLPSTPPDPWTNYGIWFDRDGVDQWQATYWGSIDGGTYNTLGRYYVVITLHAISDTLGTAYMTVNGVSQGFWVGGWKNAQPEIYPAGMTFTGDMKHMQVFYGLYGYGATHSVTFEHITVTGWLPISARLTGGGWYLTETPYSTVSDHHASFGIEAGGIFQEVSSAIYLDNDVSGAGSFTDKDYRLKAILEVTGGTYIRDYDGPGTHWVGLMGTARVYIDNKFDHEYDFKMAFAVHGDRTDRVWFEISGLGYVAWGHLIGGNVVFHT
jgi:hypothetical protein